MVKVNLNILMVKPMMDNGSMTKPMEKEFITTLMEATIMEIGSTTNNMATASSHGPMAHNMKETTLRVRKKAKVRLLS